MAFQTKNSRGQTYFLHTKEVTLRGGRQQRIYYFAKAEKPGEGLAAMPAGFQVSENVRTGLPMLKKAS